jgi:hypothetical protein
MVDIDEVVSRFLQRAEELRTLASSVKDADCRKMMLAWAADYERLVEEAIQASRPAEP